MDLISIPAFQDNYIWVLSGNSDRHIIVDPGRATPVPVAIKESQRQPEAILLTHRHQGHVGNIKQLCEKFLSIAVYGPVETQGKGVTQVVGNGDQLSILGYDLSIFSTPGHALGHICYCSESYLFYGNTMLSDDCGKFFENIAEQMYRLFMRINVLPEEIPTCCAHEYTLANMEFVLSILPDDRDINDHCHKVSELRARKQKTLPITLKNERRINLFLRVNDIDLIDKINQETNLRHSMARFTWLRSKKGDF